jgi:hypothetical protein
MSKSTEAAGDDQLVEDIAEMTVRLYRHLVNEPMSPGSRIPMFGKEQAFELTKEAIGPLAMRIQRKRLTDSMRRR